MAELVRVRGVEVKVRNPWGGFVLQFVTLGVYFFVWYYKVHRELRDYGRATGIEHRTGSSPLTSLTAVLLGWIVIVPPYVSVFRMHGRVRAAQEQAGSTDLVLDWLGFLLFFVTGIFLIPYVQTYVNKIWEAERGPAAAVAAAAA